MFNTKILSAIVNNEFEKTGQRFKANSISFNVKKTKCTLFQKNTVKFNMPLKRPDFQLENKTIGRTLSIQFLGILINENIT